MDFMQGHGNSAALDTVFLSSLLIKGASVSSVRMYLESRGVQGAG